MKKQKNEGKNRKKWAYVLLPVVAVSVIAGVVTIYKWIEENRYQELMDYAMYERFQEELNKRYFNYNLEE